VGQISNIRVDAIKLLENIIDVNVHDLELPNSFLDVKKNE
jgi:hypothetical protein